MTVSETVFRNIVVCKVAALFVNSFYQHPLVVSSFHAIVFSWSRVAMALVLDNGEGGYFQLPNSQREDKATKQLIADIKAGKRKRKRQSRWGAESAKVFIPGIPPILMADLEGDKVEALMMRIRIEEISQRVSSNPMTVDETEERSPSPPPQYDGQGKRLNTRDMRIRHRIIRERQLLVDEAKTINPHFVPPSDFKQISLKKNKKIYIPIKEYPEYNFIGLIIGPRGLTQKQMEKETGAKISIRGQGSAKDNKGNRGKFAQHPDDNDDLHVLITADTTDQVKRAAKMIEKLLIPVEEGRNEHKRNQLRKLAEFNGTLRDNVWEQERLTGLTGPAVACAHCGELSHPSADCPFKGQPGFENKNIDKEFDMFLEAIGDAPASGGAPPPPPSSGGAYGAPPAGGFAPPPPPSNLSEIEKQRQYEEFMRAINSDGAAPPAPPSNNTHHGYGASNNAPPPPANQGMYNQNPYGPPGQPHQYYGGQQGGYGQQPGGYQQGGYQGTPYPPQGGHNQDPHMQGG